MTVNSPIRQLRSLSGDSELTKRDECFEWDRHGDYLMLFDLTNESVDVGWHALDGRK